MKRLILSSFLVLGAFSVGFSQKTKQKTAGNVDESRLPSVQYRDPAVAAHAQERANASSLQPSPLQNPLLNRFLPEGFSIDAVTEQGMPMQISGTLRTASEGSLSKDAVNYLNALSGVMMVQNAGQNFEAFDSWQDEVGQNHLRLQQYFNGIKVWNGIAIAHTKNGRMSSLNGRWFPTPTLSTVQPTLTNAAAEQVVRTAISAKNIEWVSLDPNQLGMLKNAQPIKSELVIFHREERLDQERLAWHISARPNLLSMWEYFIDAQTGEILNLYPSICDIMGGESCRNPAHAHEKPLEKANHTGGGTFLSPTVVDGTVAATAIDARNISRSLNAYQVGTSYYLIDATRPMFSAARSNMPNAPIGAIVTFDAQNTSPETNRFTYGLVRSTNNTWADRNAVSGHYNSGEAYNYYRTTFNRNSINGQGGNIFSLVNVADANGRGMDNAFWDGEAMYYGNGDQAFTPLARGLDVAGHEMSHGVVQATANLTYQNESGALNESFADVFGAMIDRDDWLMGEDVVRTSAFPSGALRSLQDPHNGGTNLNSPGYQPRIYSERYTGTQDNGGVHINSGIPNYAYYLFATDANVGKATAEKVFYRALTTYLVASSRFTDLRNGVLNAIGDLYPGNAAIVTAANNAFNTVQIGGNTSTGGQTNNYQQDLPVNPGADWIIMSAPDSSKIYLMAVGSNNPQLISNTKHASKPSISDSGEEIVFVGIDQKIHYLSINWQTGNISTEQTFSNWGDTWNNVVISKKGDKLAATSIFADTSVFVYEDALQVWKKYKLYNPTYTQGISTGAVVFADALEWDHVGEYVMYDAYNRLVGQNGVVLDFWDVGFLRAWNRGANTWGDGKVEKLFSGLPAQTSVANPTFAKNSPYVVAFDWIDRSRANTVLHVWGANIQSGKYDTIFINNVLGYPSYSRIDDRVIFNYDNNGVISIAQKNVIANKIRGTGTATLVRASMNWGSWFGNGVRRLATQEVGKENKISVFPNPFSDQLTLDIESATGGVGKLELFDILGRKVFEMPLQLQAEKRRLELPLGNLSNGTYLLRTTIGSNTASQKVVKGL
ncbi:MAG: hypothetical protein RL757_2133 [Bacteroidota bacterium]|jgi:Zn-dependent metalloprotease